MLARYLARERRRARRRSPHAAARARRPAQPEDPRALHPALPARRQAALPRPPAAGLGRTCARDLAPPGARAARAPSSRATLPRARGDGARPDRGRRVTPRGGDDLRRRARHPHGRADPRPAEAADRGRRAPADRPRARRWRAAPASRASWSTPTPTPEQMRAHLARVAPEALISHEPERLETGGGLKRALPLLGPGAGLHAQRRHGLARRRTRSRRCATPGTPGAWARCWRWCRAPRRVGHAGPGDFFLGADGRLAPARRRRRRPTTSMPGAQIIDTAALGGLPRRGLLAERGLGRADRRGPALRLVHPGGWVDVGRPEGIALAEAELAR